MPGEVLPLSPSDKELVQERVFRLPGWQVSLPRTGGARGGGNNPLTRHPDPRPLSLSQLWGHTAWLLYWLR